jgi:hypothetical protein
MEAKQLKDALNGQNGLSEESKARLQQVVEQLLANKDINSRWIPDFIERRLYLNVLVLGIALLEEVLSKSEITFLGHKITLQLTPIESPTKM